MKHQSGSIKKGLMKLSHGETTGWYHVVRKGESITVRPIDPATRGPDRVLTTDQFAATFDIQEQFSLEEIRKRTKLPVNTYRVGQVNAWAHAIEEIERQKTEPRKTLVPVTKLRSLYDWLHTAPKIVHAAVAQGFAASPEAMVKICSLSQKQFASYQPPHLFEPHDRSEYKNSENEELKRTRALADRFEKRAKSVFPVDTGPHRLDLDFWYVVRELDPRNTRQGVFENGGSAKGTGAGGIDLLLAHATDGIPIVGEVKIGRDTNPFYGLVQALMYAVELCTPEQQKRLAGSFRERFADLTGTPRADVYLLLKDCPTDKLHQRILRDTEVLARGMYQTKSIASIIRRIVCLDVMNDLTLNFRFGYGEGDAASYVES